MAICPTVVGTFHSRHKSQPPSCIMGNTLFSLQPLWRKNIGTKAEVHPSQQHLCVAVCVYFALKWAKCAGSRLVQIRHWDSLGLQRAEIWYTCKNNQIPWEFSFMLSFYSPAKCAFLHFCSKIKLLLTTLGRDQTNMVFLLGCGLWAGGVGGEALICWWRRQKGFNCYTEGL